MALGSDIGGGLGQLGGLLIGDLMGAEERRQQKAMYEQMLRMYEGLPVQVDAELEDPSLLGPSAMEQISEDPALRAEQMAALRQLREISDAGGMDPAAQAHLAQSQAANASQERAQRGNLLDSFARGGQRNSGNALLAALQSGQGSAQRAGMEGLQAAGMASNRQYQALQDMGSLAGGIRSQDFGVASAKAGGADRFSEYNAAARNAAMARNADRKMQAQQGTIGNRFRQAEGITGVRGGQLGMLDAERRRKAGYGEAIGGGLGTAVGGAVGGF